MCCLCGGGNTAIVKTQREFMITTIDPPPEPTPAADPTVSDSTVSTPTVNTTNVVEQQVNHTEGLKTPLKLVPEPAATYSVVAGEELTIYLGKLVSSTPNEVEITVNTTKA